MTDLNPPTAPAYLAAAEAARAVAASHDLSDVEAPADLDPRLADPVRAALFLRYRLAAHNVDAGPILSDARHVALCELIGQALNRSTEEVANEVEASALAGFLPNAAQLLDQLEANARRAQLLAGQDDLAAIRRAHQQQQR